MIHDVGFIGFGEAARAFVAGWRAVGSNLSVATWDVLFDTAASRTRIADACRELQVTPLRSAREVATTCRWLVSAVTADQAGIAAISVGELVDEQTYIDINSAAPQNKREAARVIGATYIDAAILAPVLPARHATGMLIGGPQARARLAGIRQLFPGARVISDEVGTASTVKMIRSVFVKGLEAIATECSLAAHQAGVADEVFDSLDNTLRFDTVRTLTDYMMERIAVHGVRRAAEMEQVCATLTDIGIPDAMSRGAATVQHMIGRMQLADSLPPERMNAAGISRAALQRLHAGAIDEEAEL